MGLAAADLILLLRGSIGTEEVDALARELGVRGLHKGQREAKINAGAEGADGWEDEEKTLI